MATVVAPKRVFLLEDMPILAKMNCDILNKNGFDTETAASSDDAWNKLTRGAEFSCIILDVMVPGSMNGIELCRKLRADKRFVRAPIVMLTANASPQIEEQARGAGCDAFFSKPYQVMQLLEVIQALSHVAD
jgi:CheY-like chemotaxis protein